MATTQTQTAGKDTGFMAGDRVYSVAVPTLTGTVARVAGRCIEVRWDMECGQPDGYGVEWTHSGYLEYWTRPEAGVL